MLATVEQPLNLTVLLTPEVSAAFWSNVTRGSGCWEWKGRRGRRGGIFTIPGLLKRSHSVEFLAHRIAWQATYGELPPDKDIWRFCGTLTCCRPDHLYLKARTTETPALQSVLPGQQKYIFDDEQENLLTAFSMRGYLVILYLESSTIPVAVTTDAAQTKERAKMIALRRARRNDPNRVLGKLLNLKVIRDTDEARAYAGVDDSEYASYIEREGKYFDGELMRRMMS